MVTTFVVPGAIDICITATLLPSVVKDISALGYYAWNTTLFVVASILSAAVTAIFFIESARGSTPIDTKQ